MNNLTQKINLEVARIYAGRRHRAYSLRDQRLADLYGRYPQLEALDRAIQDAGFQRLEAALTGHGEGEAEAALEAIQMQRMDFLRARGLTEGYSQPHYSCRACQDTGRLEGQWCPCRKQIVQTILPDYLPDRMAADASFDRFNLNLFEAGDREVMADYLQMAQIYSQHFDRVKDRNLFFTGRPGTGKTFLMQCIGQRLMDQGKSVIYVTAPNLFDMIMRYKRQQLSFRPDPALLEEAEMLYQALRTWDLLLLDDLGTEQTSPETMAQLITLLDARRSRGLATIIASNEEHHKFSAHRYDNRIASRLRGYFLIYPFMGKDLRLQRSRGD